METEKLEKLKPEVKLEKFKKLVEEFDEKERLYLEEQKKQESDKNSMEFPESIPLPRIEMFVESTENSLESLRERLKILHGRELPFEATEVLGLIEKFLYGVGGFINNHRLEPAFMEWLLRPDGGDLDKLMHFTFEIVSKWEKVGVSLENK